MELLTGISSPAKPAAARDASGTVDQPLALEAVQDAHSVQYAVPGAIGHPWFSQYRPLPFLTRAEAMRRRKVLLSLQPHGESSRRLRAGLAPLYRRDLRLNRPMDQQDTACGHPTCYFAPSVRCVISMSLFSCTSTGVSPARRKPAGVRRTRGPPYCCSPPPREGECSNRVFLESVHSPARSKVENEMLHKHT